MDKVIESVGTCIRCGKELFSGNIELEDLWKYHKKIGLFCVKHEDLLKLHDEYWKEDEKQIVSKILREKDRTWDNKPLPSQKEETDDFAKSFLNI